MLATHFFMMMYLRAFPSVWSSPRKTNVMQVTSSTSSIESYYDTDIQGISKWAEWERHVLTISNLLSTEVAMPVIVSRDGCNAGKREHTGQQATDTQMLHAEGWKG